MKLNPEFVSQQIGDSTVLVPIGVAGQHFHGIIQLNSTGAFILSCLKQDTTEEKIKTAIAAEYEATEEEITQSVQETLDKLRECGALIERKQKDSAEQETVLRHCFI